MVKPKSRKALPPFLVRRPISLLLLVFLGFLVFYSLPSRNSRVVKGKWLPEYDVGDVPHYLYRSAFRSDPDYEFERRVSDALEEIERSVLGRGEDRIAKERIWQIRLGEGGRGPDSVKFEERNSDWEYSVRSKTWIAGC